MKDTYFSDDLPMDALEAMPAPKARGMRHSIRARKMPEPVQAPLQQMPAPAPATSVVIEAQVEEIAAPELGLDWHDLPLVPPADERSRKGAIPVVDLDRDETTVRAFDLLRTRLRQVTQENGWMNIGIASPTSGCGNTFTAVNLALSLSRIAGSRTVLMDLNLRKPAIAEAFGIEAPGAMSDFLAGEVEAEDHLIRLSDSLALALNGTAESHSAEILQDTRTWDRLAEMRDSLAPELVLYDLPPMLVNDDVSAFLPQLDGVLLVSDGTKTVSKQILECERMLEGQVPLLGVVLNRARKASIPNYR